MELRDLYPSILAIVLVGIVIGVGIVVLDKMQLAIESDTAQAAINSTRDGIDDFVIWIPVIVIIIAAAIIIGMVIRSFRA